MADRIELSELETYLYHSADILRTHVDASDYKMYVGLKEQSDKSKFELKQAIERVTNLMKSLMQQDFVN